MATTSIPPTPDHDPLHPPEPDTKREWMQVEIGLVGLVAVLAAVIAFLSLAIGRDDDKPAPVATTHESMAQPAATKAATLADAKGIAFEKFQPVDPNLPAVPAGAVKKFTVDVLEHVTQVAPDLAPTKAWTYAVNGTAYRGTAASPPIVVNEGDKVQITFVNGGSKKMGVTMPHSIDFHSAEVAPDKNYVDVAPGRQKVITFVAEHPGVFMYHCATQPVLTHTSNGMSGMMVVKPRNLPAVDRELWITQQEFYLGKPGETADTAKMAAETPDVMAFNGYANQYKEQPISVRKGERIRMYVLDAGPSKWSAFHVIGTVFDRTVVEGTVGHDSQTMNLAPSQGGWAEFTLDQEGSFPFVTHAFGDMTKGAAGMLRTEHAAQPAEAAAEPAAAGGIGVTLGEMFVEPTAATAKAGKVSFDVTNTGATMHQFAIGRAPLAMDGAEPAGSAALVKGKMLAAGAKETLTVDLKPGDYVLYCLLGGHYAAGQHTEFTVTG